jgi:DNA-binding PadR family transcriptional regulator
MSDEREPLRPLIFQILLLLAEKELHGYGIMKEVNERAERNVILGPGTLYRTLKQLRDDGLIAESRVESGDGADRRMYELTDAGRHAAQAEAERMAELVDRARANELLG